MDFYKLKVHFIGIGGIGVSGLARFLKAQGAIVSGSDIAETPIIQALRKEGIDINIPHAKGIIANKDLIIHSAIIQDSNIEIIESKKLNKQIFSRKDAIKVLLSKKQVLSICAAHGKSSTSAILASILSDSGAIIGAISKEFDSNVRVSTKDTLVFEADESDKSFLHSNPYKSIVVNIEAEHLENYNHDFEKLKDAYTDFINLSHYALVNIDCPTTYEIYNRIQKKQNAFKDSISHKPLSDTHLPIITPFSPKRDIKNITYTLRDNLPFTTFELQNFGEFSVYGIGYHNALNASMAILAAMDFLSVEEIRANLLHFRGIKKRFDILQELCTNAPCIIDDYAHHPTEIVATLSSARIYAKLLQKKCEAHNHITQDSYAITAIFQPHKYSRFKDNVDAFCQCFEDCDNLVILPVYAAGEQKIDFDFPSLFKHYNPIFATRIKRINQHIALLNDKYEIIQILNSGIIIGLGAGDITYQLRGEK